jgi:hypothetical protein
MRLIKLALISFVIFFGIITAMSLLIPSHIRISKAINMHAPKDSIFSLVANQKQWPRWHPAFQQGHMPELLQQNKITITPLQTTDTLVTMQWQQEGRRPVINGWQLHEFASTDSLTMQWYMDFNLPWYPWEKFGSLFYEKTYGVMMEKGLSNLKQTVQN